MSQVKGLDFNLMQWTAIAVFGVAANSYESFFVVVILIALVFVSSYIRKKDSQIYYLKAMLEPS